MKHGLKGSYMGFIIDYSMENGRASDHVRSRILLH